MITTKAEYEVVRQQLERLDRVISGYRDELKEKNPQRYAIWIESYLEMRKEMLEQIDEYFRPDPLDFAAIEAANKDIPVAQV